MAALGAIYRTDADREWLKVFALSLTDEHSKFYEQYWREQQRALRPALAAADSQFSQRYLKQLRSYLRGVQLQTGEVGFYVVLFVVGVALVLRAAGH